MLKVQERLEAYRRQRKEATQTLGDHAEQASDNEDQHQNSASIASPNGQPASTLGFIDTCAIDLLNFYPMRKWREFNAAHPMQCWVLTACLWLSGQLLAAKCEFGLVYLLLSAFTAMFLNLGARREGELSAYSVFNPNCERLLGQMDMEHFERDVMMRRRVDVAE